MKYFKIILLLLIAQAGCAQKNFIDQPFVETASKKDTLVMPDRIYLNIMLTEKDTKGKTSTEDLEKKMAARLKALGVDLDKQLSLSDVSSNFKKYFLKQKDVLKAKLYVLLVYDADTAGRVIAALEEEDISNVSLDRTEYSKIETLKLALKGLAAQKAKETAAAMLKPLGQKPGAVLFVSDLGVNYTGILQGQAAGIRIRGVGSISYNDKEYVPLGIEFEKIKVEAEVQVKFKIE